MTTDGPAKTGRGRNSLFLTAAALVAAWLGSIALLAVRTANPVTVNRAQLLSSDAVVVAVAQPSEARGVSLHVETILAGDASETIHVGGVEPGRFSAGGRFIVPLRETDRGLIVTPTPASLKSVPFVYPATDDALKATEEILTTAAAKPYE